jgi:hypothetical protein
MALVQEFDFSVELLASLIWRFNTAEKLTALIQAKQNWYDQNQETFWNDWFTNVFDLDTANEFGCSVWAIILGIPTTALSTVSITEVPFGFGNFNSNFGNSNFSPVISNPGFLSLAETQLFLKLRYYQLTSRGNVYQTNKILAALFGEGNVYIVDNLNMTITCFYKAASMPTALFNLIQEYDVMPRPSCVKLSYTAL